MTDKDALFLYRLKQAEETLAEAEKMVEEIFTSRSIINRAYYAMFYAVLALFLKTEVNIRTSKHSGVISVFDREFIKTGRIDKRYSKILHNVFDDRQEGDYKELVEIPFEKAAEAVKLARVFIETIKDLVK